MNNTAGALFRFSSNLKTKLNKVQPGKVSVIPSSKFKKPCLQAAYERQK